MSWLLALTVACTPFRVLPVHHPAALRRAPMAVVEPIRAEGWRVILELAADDSVSPVGARFDRGRRKVDQTLLIAEPGYALFEATARALERSGATVYRAYGPRLAPRTPGVQEIRLRVEHVELHHFRYRDGATPVDVVAAQVDVTATVGGTDHRLSIRRRVPSDADALAALGRVLAWHLAEVRP